MKNSVNDAMIEAFGAPPLLNLPGVKHDSGKPQVGTLMHLCSRALIEMAKVADRGTEKYTKGGWLTVPNGEERYLNAMQRHELSIGMGHRFDEEGLLLAAQVAVNAMFRLELMLRREERERESLTGEVK